MAGYAETLDSNAKMRKRPKPQLRSIELSKAANGGVIAEHRMTEYSGKEEKHVFGADEGHKLSAHIEKHLGIKIAETHGEQSEEPEKEADED